MFSKRKYITRDGSGEGKTVQCLRIQALNLDKPGFSLQLSIINQLRDFDQILNLLEPHTTIL